MGPAGTAPFVPVVERWRAVNDARMESGAHSWDAILLEEVFEALVESTPPVDGPSWSRSRPWRRRRSSRSTVAPAWTVVRMTLGPLISADELAAGIGRCDRPRRALRDGRAARRGRHAAGHVPGGGVRRPRRRPGRPTGRGRSAPAARPGAVRGRHAPGRRAPGTARGRVRRLAGAGCGTGLVAAAPPRPRRRTRPRRRVDRVAGRGLPVETGERCRVPGDFTAVGRAAHAGRRGRRRARRRRPDRRPGAPSATGGDRAGRPGGRAASRER